MNVRVGGKKTHSSSTNQFAMPLEVAPCTFHIPCCSTNKGPPLSPLQAFCGGFNPVNKSGGFGRCCIQHHSIRKKAITSNPSQIIHQHMQYIPTMLYVTCPLGDLNVGFGFGRAQLIWTVPVDTHEAIPSRACSSLRRVQPVTNHDRISPHRRIFGPEI